MSDQATGPSKRVGSRWTGGAGVPNWKGGRSVASNGYVLIRVGTQHPLADVRGYAYEHRLVAEQKIGRPLREREEIHHVNGDKTDNRPENLQVMPSAAAHHAEHRKRGDLRMPGEDNPEITCACGCGSMLSKYDESNRPRSYISGHNDHPSPTREAVLAALASGPMHKGDLVAATGKGPGPLGTALNKLKQGGLVVRLGHGIWGLCHAQ